MRFFPLSDDIQADFLSVSTDQQAGLEKIGKSGKFLILTEKIKKFIREIGNTGGKF